MRRFVGIALLFLGAWELIAPQAILGLTELRWLSHHTFPGEIIAGVILFGCGHYLLGRSPEPASPSDSAP